MISVLNKPYVSITLAIYIYIYICAYIHNSAPLAGSAVITVPCLVRGGRDAVSWGSPPSNATLGTLG